MHSYFSVLGKFSLGTRQGGIGVWEAGEASASPHFSLKLQVQHAVYVVLG